MYSEGFCLRKAEQTLAVKDITRLQHHNTDIKAFTDLFNLQQAKTRDGETAQIDLNRKAKVVESLGLSK